MRFRVILFALSLAVFLPGALRAEVLNLRLLTDASPDYHDMAGMVHSVTSRWNTPAEKCWAMFYWNHIARRQTNPMHLHGLALTDPIRQFNDYGYAMCSTISGMNCAIWHHMGLKSRYWDISNHTVSEVFYDGRWHMYDNSLTALYTLCDGRTLAGVEEIGREGACAASGGKVEHGHIAKYHCITSTSPNGFLMGADTIRSLDEEYRCFNPNGLKYRSYFYDWDWGHRYILNLRPGESYTRHYRSYGDEPEHYIPNNGKDPELVNPRYRIRGNGQWRFVPPLDPANYASAIHSAVNVAPQNPAGLHPATVGTPADVIYKIQSANVAASMRLSAAFDRAAAEDAASISISTNNGLAWNRIWSAETTGRADAELKLIDEVNGHYEILIRIELLSTRRPADAALRRIEFITTTQLNTKTQPRLNIGRNTIYVGADEQADSIVFWPELQAGRYRRHIVEDANIASVSSHIGYQGAIHPARASEDAYVVYRIDAPRPITRLTYGGRFYNRAPRSRIELLYSLDAGETWTRSWSLTDTAQPWDVIHYQTVDLPPGHRSVWVKYLMNTTNPSPAGCSIYALRIEANHAPVDPRPSPVEVTFTWNEVRKDRSLTQRSHTQLITEYPATYTINVAGDDHPVMESLRVRHADPAEPATAGYSDGRDVGGRKFVGRWVKYGRNLAVGKSYECSHPSETNWDAGDPDGRKLTDGIVGPPYSGGTSYRTGAIWSSGKNPVITVDLGEVQQCASVGLNFHGYPGWDALKGEIQDTVEVLISEDGRAYRAIGFLRTDLRWKDIPVNHMWTDEETMKAETFRLIPEAPIAARFVRFAVTSPRHFCATEVEVLDSIEFTPFDLRIALPADAAGLPRP